MRCLSLSLSLAENVHFRNFLHVVDPKYTPVARSTITSSKIPQLVNAVKATLVEKLSAVPFVSLTVDIWTDRRMRSFFGCTVHFIEYIDSDSSREPTLSSNLLCCERFTGSHTGERIGEFFEKVVDEVKTRNKIMLVLIDNASNMRKAFRLAFCEQETHDEQANQSADDDDD